MSWTTTCHRIKTRDRGRLRLREIQQDLASCVGFLLLATMLASCYSMGRENKYGKCGKLKIDGNEWKSVVFCDFVFSISLYGWIYLRAHWCVYSYCCNGFACIFFFFTGPCLCFQCFFYGTLPLLAVFFLRELAFACSVFSREPCICLQCLDQNWKQLRVFVIKL